MKILKRLTIQALKEKYKNTEEFKHLMSTIESFDLNLIQSIDLYQYQDDYYIYFNGEICIYKWGPLSYDNASLLLNEILPYYNMFNKEESHGNNTENTY